MNKSASSAARKNYNAIDLMKFFMAVCVVAIHTNPLISISNAHVKEIYEAVVRMAVPFFFLSSGYLLAVKMDYPYDSAESQQRIQKQLLRMIKLYVLWTILYLPWTVHGYASSGMNFSDAVVPFLRGFFLLGEHAVSWMLWYLLSTIYSLLLILLLLKKQISPKVITAVGAGLLFLGVGIDALMDFGGELPGLLSLARKVISHTITHGRLFQGVFYLSFGMLLAHRKLSLALNWVLLLLGFGANCLISNTYISQFLILASAIGLFGLVERWSLKDSPIYPILRTTSTGIYFLHMFVWTAYNKITVNADIWGMDCFLATTAVCIGLSLVYLPFREIGPRCWNQ